MCKWGSLKDDIKQKSFNAKYQQTRTFKRKDNERQLNLNAQVQDHIKDAVYSVLDHMEKAKDQIDSSQLEKAKDQIDSSQLEKAKDTAHARYILSNCW